MKYTHICTIYLFCISLTHTSISSDMLESTPLKNQDSVMDSKGQTIKTGFVSYIVSHNEDLENQAIFLLKK